MNGQRFNWSPSTIPLIFGLKTKAMWEILCWNTQCWFICETRRAQLTIAEIFWPSPSICTHTRTHTPTCASVGNISLHFQTFILPLIVIIQWYFCLLHTEIWSDHQSVWNDMKNRTNWDRLNPEELWRTTSPRCFKKPPCKAPWETMHKCTRAKLL